MKPKIIRCSSGLPEQTFQSSVDFPGDIARKWSIDTVYRIVCPKCGLIDKSGTRPGAEKIANNHKH